MKRTFCFLLILIFVFSGSLPAFAIKKEADLFLYNGEEQLFSIQNAALTATGEYLFTENAVFELDNPPKGKWNQYQLRYSSNMPLSGIFRYETDGQEKEELFYLEAGEEMVFTSYIDGYLDGQSAQTLRSLTFTSIQGEETTFAFTSLETTSQQAYSEEILYLENERYKAGINLRWGGALSCFEDKQSTVEGLSNLLNHHDTGRLVQQSYYGTSLAPYEQGDYNGTPWPYNPVQGGDLYGNASKLVEVRQEGNQIYVKSLPLEWGKDDVSSFSYMENTYTLEEDGLRVDNRFVDFSGYLHPLAQQELPAFYVVSYLDRFVYYNGEAPWTGDALTVIEDLPFWGDADTVSQTSFPLSQQNTESWCAWTDQTGYGVGLYVPNVHQFKAGRYRYNQSKQELADATNYVAPVRSIRLSSFVPLEYSYLIAAGQTEDLQELFSQKRDFTSNFSLDQDPTNQMDFSTLLFTQPDSFLAFSQTNETHLEQSHLGALFTASNLTNNDPNATIQFPSSSSLTGEEYPYVVLTAMVPSSNRQETYLGELFAGAGEQIAPEAGKSTSLNFQADGRYHGQVISFADQTYWEGVIHFLRLDYFNSAQEGDQFTLYSLRLAKTLEEAQAIAQEEENAANALLPSEEIQETDDSSQFLPSEDSNDNTLVWLWFVVGPALLMCIGMIVITKIKRR